MSNLPDLPKQLFVTAKWNGDNVASIGFLHPYNSKKGIADSKHQTQLKWAYLEHTYGLSLDERSDGFYLVGTTNRWVGGKHVRDVKVDEKVKVQPAIWENTPQSGFKIVDTNSRYSTSNKFWCVEDPRGVVFEISTEVFEKLIYDVTIIKGVIQDECIWERNKVLIKYTP